MNTHNPPNCIFKQTGDIIREHIGDKHYSSYITLLLKHSIAEGGAYNLPYDVQINLINLFWNKVLLGKPNTFNIRVWLTSASSIEGYLNDFKQNWVTLLQQDGVLF